MMTKFGEEKKNGNKKKARKRIDGTVCLSEYINVKNVSSFLDNE